MYIQEVYAKNDINNKIPKTRLSKDLNFSSAGSLKFEIKHEHFLLRRPSILKMYTAMNLSIKTLNSVYQCILL